MEQALLKNKQRKWKSKKKSNKISGNREPENDGTLLLRRDDDVMSFLKAFRKKHAADYGQIIGELTTSDGFVHVSKGKPELPALPDPDAGQMERKIYVNEKAQHDKELYVWKQAEFALDDKRIMMIGNVNQYIDEDLTSRMSSINPEYTSNPIVADFVEFLKNQTKKQILQENVYEQCKILQKELDDMKQLSNEQVSAFKERVDTHVTEMQRYRATNLDNANMTLGKISKSAAAMAFINGLNWKFKELQKDIRRNSVERGDTAYPQTLDMALQLADKHLAVMTDGKKAKHINTQDDEDLEINLNTIDKYAKKKEQKNGSHASHSTSKKGTSVKVDHGKSKKVFEPLDAPADTTRKSKTQCPVCHDGSLHSLSMCPKITDMIESKKSEASEKKRKYNDSNANSSKKKHVEFVNALLRNDDESSDSDMEVLHLTIDDTDIDEDNIPNLIDDDSDDDDHDGKTTAAVQVVNCLSHQKMEQMSRRDILKYPFITGIDTLSTLNAMKEKRLIFNIHQTEVMTINALDSQSDSTMAAEMIFGGSCRYVPGANLNILCEDYVVNNFPNKAILTPDGRLYGYDVELWPGIISKFRRVKGLMLADLSDVYHEYKANEPQMILLTVKETEEMLLKSDLPLKDNMELISTRSIRGALQAEKLQKVFGHTFANMIKLVNGGFVKNVYGVKKTDYDRLGLLREIFDVARDGDIDKARHLMKAKHQRRLQDELKGNEVAAHIDIVFHGPLGFLAALIKNSSYLYATCIGIVHEDQIKTPEVLSAALKQFFAFVQAANLKLKALSFDREKAIKVIAESPLVKDIKMVPLEKGAKDGQFEEKVGTWKEYVRYSKSIVLYAITLFMLKCLVIYSARMINWMPTKTNIGCAPAAFLLNGGEAYDVEKVHKNGIRSLDIIEFNREDTIGRNNSTLERTSTGIALYPTTKTGTWKLYDIEHDKIIRRDDVLKVKATPKVIDALNKLAKDEEEKRDQAIIDRAIQLEALKKRKEEKKALAAEKKEAADIRRNAKIAARAEKQSKQSEVKRLRALEKTMKSPPRNPRQGRRLAERLLDIPPKPAQSPRQLQDTDSARVNLNDDFMFSTQMSFKAGVKKHGDPAESAMVDELNGIDKRNVWTPITYKSLTRDQKQKIVSAIGLLAEKDVLEMNEVIHKLKARLCADGRREDMSMFMEGDLEAPTVAITSLFSILSIAGAKNQHIMTFDIGQAFLNADIANEVYVRLPKQIATLLLKIRPDYDKFLTDKGELILRLNKALYGTREAAKLWYDHFANVLTTKCGYVKSELDDCVFHRFNADGTKSTILLHVDDGIVIADRVEDLKELAAHLEHEFDGKLEWKIDTVHKYLGMMIRQLPDRIEISMEQYTKDIIEEFNVRNMSRVPAAPDLFSINDNSELLPEEVRKKFHRGVAKILFLACRTRPDILCATIFCCRRVKKATIEDWGKFLHILRYLNRTSHLCLILGGNDNGVAELGIYADAAHGVNRGGQSQSGILVTLGRGSAYAKSSRQKAISISSFEAEVYSLSTVIPTGLWIQDFISECGYADEVNTGTIYEDNKAAIHAIKAGKTSSDKTRHIRIRKLFTKQFLDSGRLIMTYCPTEEMIADILTKPLQGELFEKLRDLILGYTVPSSH